MIKQDFIYQPQKKIRLEMLKKNSWLARTTDKKQYFFDTNYNNTAVKPQAPQSGSN